MVDFDTSKANQTILMSEATRDLLNALFNADLPFRNNIAVLPAGQRFEVNGDVIELFPSHHMLGGVQVKVTCSDAYRVGYSSDFYWPIDDVIDVDELIVDATYGDPTRARAYTQQMADDHVVNIVLANLRAGRPTAVIGHNGRLQHALYLLSQYTSFPCFCSPRAFPLIDVYRKYGYSMPNVIRTDTSDAIALLRRRDVCLAFVTLNEQRHLPWVERCAKVVLSAHMWRQHDPVTRYGNGDCCIAMTDHADFHGTMEYIKATGASLVWTDPRSGNAEALANAVLNQLSITSHVVPILKSLGWG